MLGVEALRQNLDIDRVSVLLGHSHGASVALAYANCWPEHVEKLILISNCIQGVQSALYNKAGLLEGLSSHGLMAELSEDARYLVSNPANHSKPFAAIGSHNLIGELLLVQMASDNEQLENLRVLNINNKYST